MATVPVLRTNAQHDSSTSRRGGIPTAEPNCGTSRAGPWRTADRTDDGLRTRSSGTHRGEHTRDGSLLRPSPAESTPDRPRRSSPARTDTPRGPSAEPPHEYNTPERKSPEVSSFVSLLFRLKRTAIATVGRNDFTATRSVKLSQVQCRTRSVSGQAGSAGGGIASATSIRRCDDGAIASNRLSQCVTQTRGTVRHRHTSPFCRNSVPVPARPEATAH